MLLHLIQPFLYTKSLPCASSNTRLASFQGWKAFERSKEEEKWNHKRKQRVQKEKSKAPLSGILPLSGTQEVTGGPLRGKLAVEGKKSEARLPQHKDEEKEKEVVEREERKKICVKIKKLKRKRKGKKKLKEKKKRKFRERKRKKKKMRGKTKKSYEKSHPHLKKNHRKEKKFKCVMEIFKKLEIKVPMIETLQQGTYEGHVGKARSVPSKFGVGREHSSLEAFSLHLASPPKVTAERHLPLSGTLPDLIFLVCCVALVALRGNSGPQEVTGGPLRGKLAAEGKKSEARLPLSGSAHSNDSDNVFENEPIEDTIKARTMVNQSDLGKSFFKESTTRSLKHPQTGGSNSDAPNGLPGLRRKVHDDLIQAQLKLGTPVRFKNKLWVVKDYKENGVIEIEAPYSRRVKKVDRKQLMSWCDERKRNTNIQDGT
ncbi:hypothetical protein LR48_Vigan05g085600 [Vigna angularis]|uniref:Uncharacterized protein n=1 Tax=Phaseolus angularis TaxID=3914 RepID=A0A0L9UL02_PHAAN|nr:hypothetical protein LR48_Vigan05g085600 [Vigna angularis]